MLREEHLVQGLQASVAGPVMGSAALPAQALYSSNRTWALTAECCRGRAPGARCGTYLALGVLLEETDVPGETANG